MTVNSYCSEYDYSVITDEYPTHSFYKGDEYSEEYKFSWYNFDPHPDHWYDSEMGIDFDGTTYWFVDAYTSTPTECPTPCLPPLQGPPPSDQLSWCYQGYPPFDSPLPRTWITSKLVPDSEDMIF